MFSFSSPLMFFIFLRWKRVKVFLLASERAKTFFSFKDRLGASNCRLINSGPKLFTLSMFISVSFPSLVESKRRMYALNMCEKYIMCSGPNEKDRKGKLDFVYFVPFIATIFHTRIVNWKGKRRKRSFPSLPVPPLINI